MTIDEDTLIAYALATLSSEEEREVVRYLHQHPEAAEEVQAHFAALTTFTLSHEPEELPKDAEERLLACIRRAGTGAVNAKANPQPDRAEPPSPDVARVIVLPREVASKGRRPVRWLGLAAAAAALILTWFGLLGPQVQLWQAQRQLEEICVRPGAICQVLVDDLNHPIGTLARQPNNSLFVLLEGGPPAGQVYQAWEMVDGTPFSVGVYEGRVIDIREPLSAESVFCLTLEPPGGSAQPTAAPFVVVQL
ncbi:MAG: anti-sigma factor [Deinococcota bacterium]|jgi:hypothetical protein|nr:anti-sigma factor [Deinococcota bacterium]